MLVLTRKPGESIIIGKDITVTILEVRGNRVRVGIAAPADVPVSRSELNEFWVDAAPSPKTPAAELALR